MTVDTNIVSIISSVGFPIVMCLILIWYIVTENKRTTEVLTEIKTIVTTLSNNIDKLIGRTKDDD